MQARQEEGFVLIIKCDSHAQRHFAQVSDIYTTNTTADEGKWTEDKAIL